MAAPGLLSTEQDQALFFKRVEEGFHAACARTGEIVRDFRVAGTAVRLRFAGDALSPTLTAGLAHPVSGLSNAQHFEILIWDSESSGVSLTPPPRAWEDFTTRGNIWGFESTRYRSAYHWGEGSVNLTDRETQRAIYWVPSFRDLPLWVLSCPLRSILHWWLELNGRQLVHGAAVGTGDGAALIPGRSGAGKSSTSLACLMHGLQFVADDYLALALDPEPRAYSLYSTAKLDAHSLAQFPDLPARCRSIKSPGFEKTILFLGEAFADQLPESLPVTVVLNPRISGQPETRTGPDGSAEVERALSSGTLAHLPHVSERTVEFLGRVSRELPRATIHLGTDRSRIAQAIRDVLAAPSSKVLPELCTPDPRPYVSVLVHLREDDGKELQPLLACLGAQEYPRMELFLTADPAARGIVEATRNAADHVQIHVFDDPVPVAVAWNRAIRESFSELLMFLEPGDRLAPAALANLAGTLLQEPRTAWICGQTAAGRGGLQSPLPLAGAIVRKNAFRECGLFDPNPLLAVNVQQSWLAEAATRGLAGQHLDVVTLLDAATARRPVVDLRPLRKALNRRRHQPETV